MTKLTDTQIQAMRNDIMRELRQEMRAQIFKELHGPQATHAKEQLIKDIMAEVREEMLDEMRAAGVQAPDRRADGAPVAAQLDDGFH